MAARPQPVRRQRTHREYALFRKVDLFGILDDDGAVVMLLLRCSKN
jgi:hypothetical protein